MYLSIDPGINNTGVTVFDCSNIFIIYYTLNIENSRKNIDEYNLEIERDYGTRTVKVINIMNIIKKIVEEYNIKVAIIEAPFFNSTTPVAFGSLLEIINALKYNLFIPKKIKVNFIEPLLIKKIFTKDKLANKELMKSFLLKKIEDGEIILNLKDSFFNVGTLSDHQVDSIAIGYSYFIFNKGLLNKDLTSTSLF